MSTTTALLIGVGLGVSVGLLFAPASGEEIRSNLADKVQDFGDKVRNRFSSEPQPASGTYGE
jgi:gas vesicle protein